jgi:hypothetical protein
MGTQGKQPVDIIDFNTTDALSTINGTVGYGVDGYTFIAGTRVIFARDNDPDVRDKVYVVEFVTLSDDGSSFSEPVINLVPASDADVFVDQTVVCLSGNTLQGISFYYDGVQWIRTQQKTGVNQAPLFDVYDSNGYSLSNPIVYPSSTFAGSKLFSYALGPGLDDEEDELDDEEDEGGGGDEEEDEEDEGGGGEDDEDDEDDEEEGTKSQV